MERRLLELIERYEVVLMGGHFEPPLSPVFRWKADETQLVRRGGEKPALDDIHLIRFQQTASETLAVPGK